GFAKLRQVTVQAYHLFADVAAVGKIGNLLSQPSRIDLDELTVAAQEFADAFLQTRAVSLNQSGRGVFNDGNKLLYSFDPLSHLLTQCFAFLGAHFFKLIKCLGERSFNTGNDIVAESIA